MGHSLLKREVTASTHFVPLHIHPQLRNEALQPLLNGSLSSKIGDQEQNAEDMSGSDAGIKGKAGIQRKLKHGLSSRVVFVNDVFFCTQHLLRLVMHGHVSLAGGVEQACIF